MQRILIPALSALLLAACASAPPTARAPAPKPAPATAAKPAVQPSAPPAAAPRDHRDEVAAFIVEMVQRNGFDRAQLEAWFKQVEFRKDIVDAISRPAEGKPWYQYRPIFIQRARIEGGAEFWERHVDALQRAEARYGVPAEIITAIIGVETRYGTHQGKYRIIDALSTLAFDYPPRAKFFRSELEQYLILTREERIDPLDMKGSYAGAFGQPQFISSSFRRYAVDFDGDGHRDLWNNPVDAIGSVANYLKENGWERGGTVAVPATANGVDVDTLLKDGVKPTRPWKELRSRGVVTPAALTDQTPAVLIAYQQEAGPEYWLGMQNFYVITRYNRSPLYAMAVYQLSQEIRALHDQRAARAGG